MDHRPKAFEIAVALHVYDGILVSSRATLRKIEDDHRVMAFASASIS